MSAVVRRRAERAAKLALAAAWAIELSRRLEGLRAAVVVGSVARGDFNLWSDLDVLIVADGLPDSWLARCDAVAPVPPGMQAIAWTPDELRARRRRHDPIAEEAEGAGVVVWGSLGACASE